MGQTCTVHKIELSYSLTGQRTPEALIRNPLIELLAAVRAEGSISGAARALRLSYRHVWGELKRWERELGRPLIVWERGQAAQLTAFGDKLLWAERQAQARLASEIAALHANLERAFGMAFDDATHALTVQASHDSALVLLREHCLPVRLHLDIGFTGSVDALRALRAHRCTLAGFHAPPRPPRGGRIERAYAGLLPAEQQRLIGFARRVQGLAVAPGNPLALSSMADIAARKARFVNRPEGTGSRLLTDALCDEGGVPVGDLAGYDHEEPSHAAVAQTIASGRADVGLCIEAAARSRGLDFVPLLWEEYFLVCLAPDLEQPALRALLAVLRSDDWQRRLASLAGYAPARSGQVLDLHEALPWASAIEAQESPVRPGPRKEPR